MKLTKKILLAGLLFNLLGCSTPVPTGGIITGPVITNENNTASNFRKLQDQFNTEVQHDSASPVLSKSTIAATADSNPLRINDIKPAKILFDTGKNPLGLTDKNAIRPLASLTRILEKYNFKTAFSPISGQNLNDFDVIALISPSLEYSPEEIQTLAAFVKSGKKLVITGEWGGYSGFSPDSINEFLKQVNLRINQDLVKESENTHYQSNPQQLLVSSFQQSELTANISKLVLFSTASIEILDENTNKNEARIVALSSNNSFKIKADEKQAGLVAISHLEQGTVILVGDTSLFTDQQVNANGKVNLEEENNEQFALNIFSN
jgi:hypothetical protein